MWMNNYYCCSVWNMKINIMKFNKWMEMMMPDHIHYKEQWSLSCLSFAPSLKEAFHAASHTPHATRRLSRPAPTPAGKCTGPGDAYRSSASRPCVQRNYQCCKATTNSLFSAWGTRLWPMEKEAKWMGQDPPQPGVEELVWDQSTGGSWPSERNVLAGVYDNTRRTSVYVTIEHSSH